MWPQPLWDSQYNGEMKVYGNEPCMMGKDKKNKKNVASMFFLCTFAFANEKKVVAFSLGGANDNKPLDASREYSRGTLRGRFYYLSRHFLFLALGFCFLFPPMASAQAPAQTRPPKPKRPWEYNISLGGELKTGNVNTFVLNNKASVERNDSLLSLSARYAIIYGKKDKEVYDMGLNASVQADLWQYDRWSPFLLFSYLNNKFKGFEYKFNGLIGAKYRIYTLPGVCDYSISAAYMQEWVEYFAADRGNERLRPQLSRLSLRFKIKQKITSAVNIVHMTFYQPSLMELKELKSFREDFVISSITSVQNKIGRNIFLDVNFDFEYRSVVPKKVKNTDIITSVALRMKF